MEHRENRQKQRSLMVNENEGCKSHEDSREEEDVKHVEEHGFVIVISKNIRHQTLLIQQRIANEFTHELY